MRDPNDYEIRLDEILSRMKPGMIMAFHNRAHLTKKQFLYDQTITPDKLERAHYEPNSRDIDTVGRPVVKCRHCGRCIVFTNVDGDKLKMVALYCWDMSLPVHSNGTCGRALPGRGPLVVIGNPIGQKLYIEGQGEMTEEQRIEHLLKSMGYGNGFYGGDEQEQAKMQMYEAKRRAELDMMMGADEAAKAMNDKAVQNGAEEQPRDEGQPLHPALLM